MDASISVSREVPSDLYQPPPKTTLYDTYVKIVNVIALGLSPSDHPRSLAGSHEIASGLYQ